VQKELLKMALADHDLVALRLGHEIEKAQIASGS